MIDKKIYVKEKSMRLDKFLEKNIELNRSQIKKHISNGDILLNNKLVKAGEIIKPDDIITIRYEEDIQIKKEDIDFKIIYEDEYIAIISKPQDLVVHPASGIYSNTLVNGLLFKFNNLSNPEDKTRPGIVHRLDKDTSGLMIIAKKDIAYYKLVDMFKNREIEKYYLAIVHGQTTDFQRIDMPIGRSNRDRKKMAVTYENSKNAITEYEKIKSFNEYSLLRIKLLTGRTHQIRVHMAEINHPILGDLVYGRKNNLKVNLQMLHAYELKFNHPITGSRMDIKDEFPKRFEKIIKTIEMKNL